MIRKQRLLKIKTRKSIIATILIFATLFSGVIPLIDLPTESRIKSAYYNPEASEYLYVADVDTKYYEFNAWSVANYIVCKVQNTAYAKFTLDGVVYEKRGFLFEFVKVKEIAKRILKASRKHKKDRAFTIINNNKGNFTIILLKFLSISLLFHR